MHYMKTNAPVSPFARRMPICLWFDGFGELAGFAISESGDAGFHALTPDGYRFLYGEMLR